jgi:DNA-binding transcriptional regulator YiaG
MTSFDITKPLVPTLKDACERAGINLSVACREAGVSRSTVERWKTDEPKTVQELRKLLKVINKHERKK